VFFLDYEGNIVHDYLKGMLMQLDALHFALLFGDEQRLKVMRRVIDADARVFPAFLSRRTYSALFFRLLYQNITSFRHWK
jgi:hypothetical protein